MSNFCQESRDYAGYARSRVLGRGGKRGGGGDQSQGLSHIDDCHDRAHARNAPQRVLEYGRLLPDAEERQHDARELRPAGPRGVRLGDGLRDELEGIPEYCQRAGGERRATGGEGGMRGATGESAKRRISP